MNETNETTNLTFANYTGFLLRADEYAVSTFESDWCYLIALLPSSIIVIAACSFIAWFGIEFFTNN